MCILGLFIQLLTLIIQGETMVVRFSRQTVYLALYTCIGALQCLVVVRICMFVAQKRPVSRPCNVSGFSPFLKSTAILLHLIWPGWLPICTRDAVSDACACFRWARIRAIYSRGAHLRFAHIACESMFQIFFSIARLKGSRFIVNLGIYLGFFLPCFPNSLAYS